MRFFMLAMALAAAGYGKTGADIPVAAHATTYPAHETHDDEKVSIALDPFDMPGKTAGFKVHYKENGFLPLRIILSNDGDKTIMLEDLKVEYVTARRDKLQPVTTADLDRRLARIDRNVGKPPVQLPIPLPRKTKPSVSKNAQEEIEQLQLLKVPVTGHSTNSGFLFFDVSGIASPEGGAHVYISGLKMDGKELWYFDIPLEKAVPSQPVK